MVNTHSCPSLSHRRHVQLCACGIRRKTVSLSRIPPCRRATPCCAGQEDFCGEPPAGLGALTTFAWTSKKGLPG